jgi:chemotaxis protein MotB
MRDKIFFFGLTLACLLMSACVSKEQYEEIEAALSDTQAKLEQKDKHVQELEKKLKDSEDSRNTCQQDIAGLQARYEEMEKSQQQLSTTLEQSRSELERISALAREKEVAIQEVDEAKRRLVTSLQSQIKTREEKIKQLEDAIAKLDETRRMLEINLMSQLSLRERKIKEQEKAISELDKTKRYYETNLIDMKEQIAVQEQTINEQMNIIAELDVTRLKIEDSLQDRQSDIELREQRIRQLQSAIAQRDKAKRQIETDLKEQINAQQIKLENLTGQLKVTFVDKILFDSGSAKINPEGKEVLSKLAESFKQNKDQNIIVQGHTDNVQIRSEFRAKYPSNWELSAARSAAVVRYLADKAGVEPQRLAASGYSFYRPLASNDTEAGRQQNRRIEIILAPRR